MVKVIKKAVKINYIFNCPKCGDRLEADGTELIDIGNKYSEFYCPTCKENRYINWSALHKKIIYKENEETTSIIV